MTSPSALFFGSSPSGTALVLSLALTLVISAIPRIAAAVNARIPLKDLRNSWKAQALLAFCVLALGCKLLAELTLGITSNTPLEAWDRTFVLAAHQALSPGEELFFLSITQLAGRVASWVLGIAVGIWLLRKRHRNFFWMWVIGLVGNAVLVQLIKQFYQRPRPVFENPFLTEANFSFPSGHAAGAVLTYGLLAYILSRTGSRLTSNPARTVLAVTWLGSFIGCSRLALGVHYPSDVLAGWTLALLWLTALVTVDQTVFHRKSSASW